MPGLTAASSVTAEAMLIATSITAPSELMSMPATKSPRTFKVTPGTIVLTFHQPIEHTGGNDIAQVSHECRDIIQQDLPAERRD